MDQPDLIYRFAAVDDVWTGVEFVDIRNRSTDRFRIRLRDVLFNGRFSHIPSLVADLWDIALAVYIADWLSKRAVDRFLHIHVVLPVRLMDRFADARIYESLAQVLHWYTYDHWTFEFIPRSEGGRRSEREHHLIFDELEMPLEVALWSGGLDALAGLIYRAMVDPDCQFRAVGTGSNKHMLGVQKRLQRQLTAVPVHHLWQSAIAIPGIPSLLRGRFRLDQIKLHLADTHDLRKNNRPRSRGFMFLLVGAGYAYLEGVPRLHVYENGVGAFNFHCFPSELGSAHSRAVHPLSLEKMDDLVSLILQSSFTFLNPFLFHTKSEICRSLIQDDAPALVSTTISCDSRHRQPYRRTQCGRCSSCLLRRQALTYLGLNERVQYVIDAPDRLPKPGDDDHWSALNYQAMTMKKLLCTADPWLAMTDEYEYLQDVPGSVVSKYAMTEQAVRTEILDLFARHVREWEAVGQTIRPHRSPSGFAA